DYTREAENQRKFAALYAGHAYIRVPRVVDSHSTAAVLTSEYVAGRSLAQVLADSSPQERSRYGEIIYRFVFTSILKHGRFNGDPHPGNYLFDGEGRVAFLDFGCVKYFPAQMLADWKRLVISHLSGDHAAFRRQIVTLGFIKPDAAVDTDTLYD